MSKQTGRRQLKFHPDTHLNYVSDMPFRCAVFRCPHKSWVHKNLTFFSFPTDPKLKQKWVAALKARTMDYKWQSNHRVCSAHFPGGRRYGTNNIPAVFPRKDTKTDQIVWPVDISYLLNAEATEATVSSSNKTENADVVCSSCEQVESEATDQQSEDTRRENVAKNDSHSEELSPEKACDCQIEIDELKKRIKDLEERREVEKFGVRRFMASDSDIRFYTGLPDYATFIALYNFVKPKPGFSLNYYNGYTNASKDPSYIVSRGRPRNLCELDELFLTLTRLRLGLLEKDLGDTFNILQQEVSQVFATWIDRLYYCLGQLSFKTDRESTKKNLPKCFKPDYEDVYLIIDCTEIFIEKPSQIIQQSCTWSEYKGHNTGKGLIAISPLLLPVFVSEIFPGSKSDEDILRDSGILSLAQEGDRWLADKGFIVQHILDNYGVIVETPEKLSGKTQFTPEQDIHNRKNSQVRVHVERAIRRVKVFRILKGNLPIRYVHHISKLWKVCCWLTAFLPPLVSASSELLEESREE